MLRKPTAKLRNGVSSVSQRTVAAHKKAGLRRNLPFLRQPGCLDGLIKTRGFPPAPHSAFGFVGNVPEGTAVSVTLTTSPGLRITQRIGERAAELVVFGHQERNEPEGWGRPIRFERAQPGRPLVARPLHVLNRGIVTADDRWTFGGK